MGGVGWVGGCCIVYLQKEIVKSAAAFNRSIIPQVRRRIFPLQHAEEEKIAEEKHNKFLVFLWFGLHCKFCNS